MDSPDCILNPNLESCKSLGPGELGLVNENHLEPILLDKEDNVRQADEERRKETELKDSLKSPETDQAKDRPKSALTFPVTGGVICTPGPGRRCPQSVQDIKVEAPDCSRIAADPSCLVSAESEGCAEVLECHYLDRDRNSPVNVSRSCEGGLVSGECGADEGNKRKITESDKNCTADTCSPGPVTMSHGETDCVPGSPLCWTVHKDGESFIKKGQADCLDGSNDIDCISKKFNCSHGSSHPNCGQEAAAVQDCSSDSTDPSCFRRLGCRDEDGEDCQPNIEKGNSNWVSRL